jgi:hypothetical protein
MIERKCKITQRFRELLRRLVNTMLAENPDLRESGTAAGQIAGRIPIRGRCREFDQACSPTERRGIADDGIWSFVTAQNF